MPEQFVSLVKVGQPVRLTVDAYPGEEFAATVRFVSPSLRVDQRALTVEAIVPNTDGRLKPGLFATALIQQRASAPALRVPETAVETVAGTSRVYVVKDGKVEERIVTIGEKVDDQRRVDQRCRGGRQRRRRAARPLTDGMAADSSRLTVRVIAVYPQVLVMQWLAAISVKRPVFATVLILSLTVVGAFSFTRLGLDRFPKVDFPTVVVTTRLPGAAPEQIETEITDKIEEAVNTISGIDELRSMSSEGVSQVIIAFLLEKDADVARAGSARQGQPRAAAAAATIDQPTVEKFDPDSAPVLTLALSAKKPIRDITEYADKMLRRQLESVNGVGQVVVVGGRARQINVWLDAGPPAGLQPDGHRRLARAADAERRDSRRPRRAGRRSADAAHARPRPVGRGVRRHRRPRAATDIRSCCATSRGSRTAWPNPTRAPTSTASRRCC